MDGLLAAKFEKSLHFHDVDEAEHLVGALLMDTIPNAGAIKGAVRCAWKNLRDFHIAHEYKNIFTITT